MKAILLISILNLFFVSLLVAEKTKAIQKKEKQIHALVDQYSKARETKDGELLKNIGRGHRSARVLRDMETGL
jgi:hypothetical protein|tara:strand:+ start:641 stop:859 length:219 start_codon:yes stop_codon:yes gene_type:complete